MKLVRLIDFLSQKSLTIYSGVLCVEQFSLPLALQHFHSQIHYQPCHNTGH